MSTAKLNTIPPSVRQILGSYGVYAKDILEAHYQPLYSILAYPAAGAANFSFFTVGSTPATLNATNLPGNGGSLPKPNNFLILGIEILFKSGQAPGVIGTSGETAADDYNAVMDQASSYFELKVGTKPYYQIAPLSALPEQTSPQYSVAIADTAAAVIANVVPAVRTIGFTPLLLQYTESFYATITFPGGAVATPSTKAGKIGVKLNGYLYQNAQ